MDVMRTGCSALVIGSLGPATRPQQPRRQRSQGVSGCSPNCRSLAGWASASLASGKRAGRGRSESHVRRQSALDAGEAASERRSGERAVRAMDISANSLRRSMNSTPRHSPPALWFRRCPICIRRSRRRSVRERPLHGGYHERVLGVLKEVTLPQKCRGPDSATRWPARSAQGFRPPCCCKDGDPRAAILKLLCAELAAETGNDSDREATADVIERIVRDEKHLPPNLIGLRQARLYHYLGLVGDLYTPPFVVSRVTCQCAHVIEQLDHNRLIRPLSKYTGLPPRNAMDAAGRAWRLNH